MKRLYLTGLGNPADVYEFKKKKRGLRNRLKPATGYVGLGNPVGVYKFSFPKRGFRNRL